MTRSTNTSAISPSETFEKYFNIGMWYRGGNNNNEIGIARLRSTLSIVARFGLISPSVVAYFYDISKRQALEHLNKMVKRELLTCVHTHRSIDGRIYICSANGAKLAEELTGIPVYFRRHSPPERGINQNTIMHDLINAHVMLSMLHETSNSRADYYTFTGLITEREFKKQMASANTRIVDGLMREFTSEGDCIVAIEIENSFKTKSQRSEILLRYRDALRAGVYDKIFLISQQLDILNDIKRFHSQLLVELTEIRSQKTKQALLSLEDAKLLEQAIIYRTKYCAQITNLFYS